MAQGILSPSWDSLVYWQESPRIDLQWVEVLVLGVLPLVVVAFFGLARLGDLVRRDIQAEVAGAPPSPRQHHHRFGLGVGGEEQGVDLIEEEGVSAPPKHPRT